jgi:hypothetical protein
MYAGWKGGALYVKAADKKLRNAEVEAVAQWNETDLSFKKEKTMIGASPASTRKHAYTHTRIHSME